MTRTPPIAGHGPHDGSRAHSATNEQRSSEWQTGSTAATDPTAQLHYRVRTRPKAIPAPAAELAINDGSACGSAYEVGYRKPPKDKRFKSGQSGNPKGRPKGTRNLKTDLREELQERISLKEGGKTKQVSKQRAMLKSLMANALQGDARSATLMFNLVARLLDQSEHDDPSTPLAADDAAILAAFEARIRNATPDKEE
jgi:Family of unknown function (DUF5681)